MRLARAGRSEQDNVLAAGEKVELAAIQDGLAPQRRLEGEVELLQRLACREPRGLIRDCPAWLSRLSVSVFNSAPATAHSSILGAAPVGELRHLAVACARATSEMTRVG